MRPAIYRNWLFWILFIAFAVRMVHLNAPVIGMHSWRQADTAAVARNFFENGFNLLKPQIDFGGAGSGYVDMEFPFYSYLVAAAYKITGVHEWWARLLSAICWTALVAAMYDLAVWAAGRRIARWTALFVAFLPLNLYYGRVFMPEPMILAGMAGGLTFFRRWLDSGRLRLLVASWLCITMACLLKIPCLYIGLPLAWLAWSKHRWDFCKRPTIWAYAVLLFVAVGAWYGYSHQLGKESGNSFGVFAYGSDKWGKWQLLTTWHYWNSILFRSIAERHLTWGGLPLFLIGLFLPRRDSRLRLFDAWALAVLVYLLVVQGGNLVHEYYQLPVILPIAFLMARGIDWLLTGLTNRRATGQVLAGLLLAGVVVLGGLRWVDYLGREDTSRSKDLELARHISALTESTERGVFLNDGNPTVMYLSHRKGWSSDRDDLTVDWLDDRASEGATFLAARSDDVPDAALTAGEVIRSEDGRVLLVRLDTTTSERD